MHDPFAMLDPVNKQKSMGGGGPGMNQPFATAPMPANGGFQPQFGNNNSMNSNPYSNMQSGMGGPPPPAPFQGSNPYGGNNPAAFITQPASQGFGGMGGTQSHNPFGQAPAFQQQSNPFQQGGMMQPTQQQQQQQQQPIMYDSIKNLLQPKQQPPVDPFGTNAGGVGTKASDLDFLGSSGGFGNPQLRAPEPTHAPASSTHAGAFATTPAPLTHSSSTIIDFDPFSPRDNTPQLPFDFQAQHAANAPQAKDDRRARQTQEEQRTRLGINSGAFNTSGSAPKISLRGLSIDDRPASQSSTPTSSARPSAKSFDDDGFFMEGTTAQEAFAGQNYGNVDDDEAQDWGAIERKESDSEELAEACASDEYDVTFESGRKLGVLMERVDVWGKRDDRRQEIAVVKLVVENGAADRVGVSVGSSVVGINNKSVAQESYTTILELIKAAPRPMTIRFKRGNNAKDTTQGSVLTRISNGTFSVGNFTRGNANWTQKYFAFGGAKLDVLQLFVSRAAYHECVISLYEKRAVHTQIQSFRLCRDHKISPIKSKIYKGYGNLHYFSLTVPSLRFVAAKFASEDYETLKNLWSHTYDAVERKKRMG